MIYQIMTDSGDNNRAEEILKGFQVNWVRLCDADGDKFCGNAVKV